MELQRLLRPILGPRPSCSQATYSASELAIDGEVALVDQPLVSDSSVELCEAGVQVNKEYLVFGEAPVGAERIVITERSSPQERDLSLWAIRSDPRYKESNQTRYFTTMRRLFPGALDATRLSATCP